MSGSAEDEARLYSQLQGLLLAVADLESFLTELAQLATEVVRDPVSCGITVRHDGHVMTVGSSDPRAELLDETQYRLGTGPCLQALATGRATDCPDTDLEQRWPGYIGRAREEGLRCVLSLPLTLGSSTLGALNAYGFERPHLFSPDLRRQLELFAAQAAGSLRLATRQVKDAQLLHQLEESLRSRTTIDQAMGILMAQQGCTADMAFDLLRRRSQSTNRRLREVAGDLIRRVTGQDVQDGRRFDGLTSPPRDAAP